MWYFGFKILLFQACSNGLLLMISAFNIGASTNSFLFRFDWISLNFWAVDRRSFCRWLLELLELLFRVILISQSESESEFESLSDIPDTSAAVLRTQLRVAQQSTVDPDRHGGIRLFRWDSQICDALGRLLLRKYGECLPWLGKHWQRHSLRRLQKAAVRQWREIRVRMG